MLSSAQWEGSLYSKRWKEFEISRDYANGTQDTSIYKQILTSLDPNNGDGSLVNLDWTPVPIIPKFVKIVVNKILSAKFYPNLEAIDPLSRSEKDIEKNKVKVFIENKDILKEAKEGHGDPTAAGRGDVRNAQDRRLQIVDRRTCTLQKNTPQTGELDFPGGSVEESGANDGFQLFDPSAQCGR